MKIVFIGSNPSCTSPVDDPFAHCMSANRMIHDWIPKLGLTRDQVEFMNVANYKTPKNRPLKASEINAELPRLIQDLKGRVVVTLGKTAQIAIELVSMHYMMIQQMDIYGDGAGDIPYVINMPHPSGRNRQLNDRAWLAKRLEEVKLELQEQINEAVPAR